MYINTKYDKIIQMLFERGHNANSAYEHLKQFGADISRATIYRRYTSYRSTKRKSRHV